MINYQGAVLRKVQLSDYPDWIRGPANPAKGLSDKVATKHGVTQIERARVIKRTLGVKVAARYMALRRWPVEAALYVLVGV